MNTIPIPFEATKSRSASHSRHALSRPRMPALPLLSALGLLCSLLCPPPSVLAAAFPGNARVEINDSTGGLGWSTVTTALTVQCWCKISIPSGVTPNENMTILVNRRTGTSTTVPYAYHLFYDIAKNSIEFATRGKTGVSRQETLLAAPFLDRWYHLAIVRDGDSLWGYVDGQETSYPSLTVGDTGSADGVSIGGWGTAGNGQYLYGEVQEVSVYQAVRSKTLIGDYMFEDQPVANPALRAYYKLSFSQSASNRLSNLAVNGPANTGGLALPADTLAYEETDRAGEQSAFDAGRNGGTSAIAPLSGSFSWEQTLLSRPTPGVPFGFRLGYGSANAAGDYQQGNMDPSRAGPLNNRWRHSFETRVLPVTYFGKVTVYGVLLWNGVIETWTNIPGTSDFGTRRKDYRGTFSVTTTNCVWVTPEKLIYTFRARDSDPARLQGRLVSIQDYNNNQVSFQYAEDTGDLTSVVHSTGGRYLFQYRSDNLLDSVSLGTWSVRFGYDANKRLVSKTLTNSSGLYTNVPATWTFNYYTTGIFSNLLQSIVDPRGNTNTVVGYDGYGRRTSTTDALGRSTRVEYGVPGNRQITTTDAEGYKWIATHDRSGRPVAQQDPLGNVSRSTYDDRGNRISTTDARGNTTLFAYDDRSNVIAQTNALGEVTRRTYHTNFNKPTAEVNALGWTTHYDLDNATGNLLRQWDDLGTLASYTYAANGLVASQADANHQTNWFAYDTNGFCVARTDAAGFTKHYLPNDAGWNLAMTNALGEVTTYAYDLNGKVVLTVDPLSRAYTATYDANGNLLTQTDAKGKQASSTYDALDQKTSEVDRRRATNWFAYTKCGSQSAFTNALGRATTYQYDAARREVSAVDALGNVTRTVYDANGNAIALVDPSGQRWTKVLDRLNRTVAVTDPLGNTTRTVFDAAGRVRESIGPNGARTVNSYDGRGRLTNWVDATGSSWSYAYDGVGNITNITDALGGHYVMVYGNRNERLLERNQDGKVWSYTYDALARLETQQEPNGTRRTVEYDDGGRITAVNFSTGRINSFLYDDNDNPVILSRSGSGPATITQLTYDEVDRVQQCTDAFGKTISYAFDDAGRLTTLTYPDGKTLTYGYDALDQLTSQVFQFSGQKSFTNTYAYDEAGRLVRRTYPNGIVQNNTFDSPGRLTGLSHSPLAPGPSSLNVALAYTYDRNGNTTVARKQGVFQWPKPSLLDEVSRFTAAGQITNRVDALNPATNDFNYSYSENGNMTNCVGGGQTWTLTYDEDNRATSMCWDPGFTAKTITNRYDAFGRRIAKTVDGVQTGYVLDLAGGMERILCDLSPSRAITAWYVHGAGLSFKVDANGSLTCYHADAQGNIIALTDAQANKVAEYAYTPFGRSLGSTNCGGTNKISNPYLFAGSQGVMSEEQGVPGLYFMRARYYSAEAGVFLSTDPIKNIGPTWLPIAYAYTENNPLRFSDPKGEWFGLDDAIAAAVGFVVGAAVDFTLQMIEHKGDISQVNGWEVLISAGVGAGTAWLGWNTGGLSLVPQLLALGAIGGAGSVLQSGLVNLSEGEDFVKSWQEGLFDFGTGFVTGLIPGGGKAAKPALQKAAKPLLKRAASTIIRRPKLPLLQRSLSAPAAVMKGLAPRPWSRWVSGIVSGLKSGTRDTLMGVGTGIFGDKLAEWLGVAETPATEEASDAAP